MKIYSKYPSLNYRVYFSGTTPSIDKTKTDKYKKVNQEALTASLAGLSCAAIGSIYLINHKSPKKLTKVVSEEIKFVDFKLPDEVIANSLPKAIKQKLSVNNNYQKLKSMFNSPNKENLIGMGANSKVYDIPFMDEYVLKIINPGKFEDPNSIPVGLFPDDVNLGQPVWVNPENRSILILKKIKGIVHSIENWSDFIYDKTTKLPRILERAHGEKYFEKISKISQMPQNTFDDLAKQIIVVDTTAKKGQRHYKGFKIDSINPNNLLIDFENNKINVIDYFAKDNHAHANSYMDMVASIADFTLLKEYINVIDSNKQKKLINMLKIIDKKCFQAAEKQGLSTDKNIFLNYIDEVNKYFKVLPVKYPDGKEYIRDYDITARELIKILEN